MGFIWSGVGAIILAILLLWILTGNVEKSRIMIRTTLKWGTIGIGSVIVFGLLYFFGSTLMNYISRDENRVTIDQAVDRVLKGLGPFFRIGLIVILFMAFKKTNKEK